MLLCLHRGISKHTKLSSGIRGSDDIADQLRREIRHIIIMRGSPQPLGWCEESEAACSFSGTLYIKHKNLSHSYTCSLSLYIWTTRQQRNISEQCAHSSSDILTSFVQNYLSTIEVSIDLIDSEVIEWQPWQPSLALKEHFWVGVGHSRKHEHANWQC